MGIEVNTLTGVEVNTKKTAPSDVIGQFGKLDFCMGEFGDSVVCDVTKDDCVRVVFSLFDGRKNDVQIVMNADAFSKFVRVVNNTQEVLTKQVQAKNTKANS